MLKIAKLKSEDFPILFQLEKENFFDFYSESSCEQELLQGNREYYILKDNENIVAYCGFLVIDDAELLRIAVNKEMRKKGYAKYLLENCISELRKKQIKKVFLEVAEDNIPAQKLYDSLNFTKISERKNYYKNNVSAIIMQRSL